MSALEDVYMLVACQGLCEVVDHLERGKRGAIKLGGRRGDGLLTCSDWAPLITEFTGTRWKGQTVKQIILSVSFPRTTRQINYLFHMWSPVCLVH